MLEAWGLRQGVRLTDTGQGAHLSRTSNPDREIEHICPSCDLLLQAKCLVKESLLLRLHSGNPAQNPSGLDTLPMHVEAIFMYHIFL